jgi:Imm-5 like putative immunity protein
VLEREQKRFKFPAARLVAEWRKSLVELLDRPASELKGHQAFKPNQKLLALWAADCAEHVLPYFEGRYPKDDRPRKAVEACRMWAATGLFKMAVIRKASLDSHAAARQAKEDDAIAAARAAGHAVATAHVPDHSIGAAVYAIKAAAAHFGDLDDCIIRERNWQLERLRRMTNS